VKKEKASLRKILFKNREEIQCTL